MSGGRTVGAGATASEIAHSSVVVIRTDAGLEGCGEFCPCGENYMEAHSHGVEAAAKLLAPALLGEDPRQVGRIEQLMDHVIRGHGYAKAPFDAACWDILGQATGQPVWMLLGGKLTDGAPMYRVAPQKSLEETAKELSQHRDAGYRQFQIKVGSDWARDIERIRFTLPLLKEGENAFADANQGWNVHEAVRVARATRDLDYILEQPCRTFDECRQVRARTDLPMKLDECITGPDQCKGSSRIVVPNRLHQDFQAGRPQQGAPHARSACRPPDSDDGRGHLGWRNRDGDPCHILRHRRPPSFSSTRPICTTTTPARRGAGSCHGGWETLCERCRRPWRDAGLREPWRSGLSAWGLRLNLAGSVMVAPVHSMPTSDDQLMLAVCLPSRNVRQNRLGPARVSELVDQFGKNHSPVLTANSVAEFLPGILSKTSGDSGTRPAVRTPLGAA